MRPKKELHLRTKQFMSMRTRKKKLHEDEAIHEDGPK
jgi:hypothetical protein